MRWVSCPVDVTQGGPTPRMGHIAAVVEGNGAWQESLLIFHGGLSEDKVALQDLGVLQLGCGSWLRPQPVKPGPPARSFHSGAALSSSLYIFGGHVWQRDTREIRKFNDLWRLDTVSETPVDIRTSLRSFWLRQGSKASHTLFSKTPQVVFAELGWRSCASWSHKPALQKELLSCKRK